MRFTIAITFILLIIMFIFTGCGGVSDYSYLRSIDENPVGLYLDNVGNGLSISSLYVDRTEIKFSGTEQLAALLLINSQSGDRLVTEVIFYEPNVQLFFRAMPRDIATSSSGVTFSSIPMSVATFMQTSFSPGNAMFHLTSLQGTQLIGVTDNLTINMIGVGTRQVKISRN